MNNHIVGMLWNKDEGDILAEIIESALTNVDSLFIADDGSTDNSWNIIQDFAKKRKDKIEYIRNKRENPIDKGQRQALLTEIQKRYKGENTWVQIIESDIMILDTNIKEAINSKWASSDLTVSWQTINAGRKPNTWKEVDTYPNWDKSITKIMPYGHWMEVMLYTFRPMPKIRYNLDTWRPWPQGFTAYSKEPLEERNRGLDAPLLAHYGFRGPTHFYEKFKKMGKTGKPHSKYPSWDLRNPETIAKTVSFFNGEWNGPGSLFPMSRKGWIAWRKG